MVPASYPDGFSGPAPFTGPRGPLRTIILGAAGRDFHNFNVVFRDNPAFEVVTFTSTQIPGTAWRTYPYSLAGGRYPRGIPIIPEEGLGRTIQSLKADLVALSYSDISHEEVMHLASIALAAGASYVLLGPNHTMLQAKLPVLAVCAVRTGIGKSPTSRFIVRWALKNGLRPAIVCHPMPYGDLEQQAVQRFQDLQDLDAAQCTIEEREEYEPYLEMGVPVYAGVDYAQILDEAQRQADFILWDGGNNDFPFVRPDLHICLLDPHRPGHEVAYFPGEVNYRMANLFIITKADSAPPEGMKLVLANLRKYRPRRPVVLADLAITVDHPDLVRGKKVLVVEDGPTLTHGGVPFGAGVLAARRLDAEVVDPRPWLQGSMQDVLAKYPHIQNALPAMGYSAPEAKDLESTIQAVPCQAVIDATPVNLSSLMKVYQPLVQVSYELQERGDGLIRSLERFARRFHLLQTSRG